MTRESDHQVQLLSAEVRELRRAVAELAQDLHGISQLEQIARSGKPALARLLAAYRTGALQTAERRPEETRA